MAEAAFRVLQIGKEGTFGTEVDATLIYPCDPGSAEFTLNRATETPDEDFGRLSSTSAGRSSTGVRIATASLSSAARFEDLGYWLSMALGTASTAGTAAGTATWTADETSSTADSYTVESADGVQPFIATGVVVTGFELGFDAIGAGENAMWTFSADLQAADLGTGTVTSGLSVPTTLTTIEGHLSRMYEGPAGTAFASLSELSSSLVSYRCRVTAEKPLRPYGGTADKATSHGSRKRQIEVSGLVKLASTPISDFWDIYNVSGSLPTSRRMRVKSVLGTKDLTIDHRLIYNDVHVEPDGRDGERLLSFTARGEYDSSLSSNLQIVIGGIDVSSL